MENIVQLEEIKVEETTSNEIKKSNNDQLLNKIASILYIVAQITIIASLTLLGICSVDGMSVNVFTCTNLLFNLFSTTEFTWYFCLSTCLHGILYVIFTIKILIEFFSRISLWKSGKVDKLRLITNLQFKMMLTYLFVSSIFNEVEIEGITYFIFIAIPIINFIGETAIVKNYKGIKLEFTPLNRLIKYVILILLLVLFNSNYVENFINSFMILGTIQWDAGAIVASILYQNLIYYIIGAIIILTTLNLTCNYLNGLDNLINWKNFMVFSIVIFSIDLLVYLGVTTQGSISAEVIIDYLTVIKSELVSLLLISIAGFINCKGNK